MDGAFIRAYRGMEVEVAQVDVVGGREDRNRTGHRRGTYTCTSRAARRSAISGNTAYTQPQRTNTNNNGQPQRTTNNTHTRYQRANSSSVP